MDLRSTVSSLPDELKQASLTSLQRLCENTELASISDEHLVLLAKAIALSPFVADTLCRMPELLERWFADGSPLFEEKSQSDMLSELSSRVELCASEEDLMSVLRRFRNSEQARIIIRDLCGLTDLDATLREVSALADVSIQQALSWQYQRMIEKHGVPRCRKGRQQHLVVLGMGKLGACELNVSSDIDLIFAYPESGETDHANKPMENHRFFTKLGQRLIHALDQRTEDGFVYRVDMRLRPYGSSGALALNFSGFEDYFQTQGREWERFAMIKARAITGEQDDRDRLISGIVHPFVFRKYPDFSSFDALREMKRLIMSEVHRKGGEQNIKLGSGGIREIEFIAQATQLIYGGRDPRLQDTGLQSVYRTLAESDYLPAEWVSSLLNAYRYLRDLEHAIQGYNDQQTQLLPSDMEAQVAAATALGHPTWERLLEAQTAHRAQVTQIFEDFLHEESAKGQKEARSEFAWLPLWQHNETGLDEWVNEFARAGYDHPKEAAELMIKLHETPRLRSMSATSRDRFEEFLPRLLDALIATPKQAQTLDRVLHIVNAVLGRTIYLVLLNENEQALHQLCKLCSESQWFADHIAATPVVLDDLLNPKTLYNPPPREALGDELRQSLLRIPEDDLEAQMDCLRNFKQSHMLRVAAAEISGVLPVMKVSDYLTWLAEACLDAALGIAWRNLEQKHGRPDSVAEGVECAGFAVVGYGKLGGIELGYSSDLDMVFIYDAPDFGSTNGEKPINNQLFYTRLGQRLVHILGAQTSQGYCYEVDMRLRPSGNSGMLVSSLAAFEKYQHQDAWTWEHQALVRARFIAGDSKLGNAFVSVRHKVLSVVRERGKLLEDVRNMREKMNTAAADKFKSSELADINIKQGRGGLIDIEFITQYLILAYSNVHPTLTKWTDNVRLLESLGQTIELSLPYEGLIDAYRNLRSALHKKSLSGEEHSEGLAAFPEERKCVQETFAELFKE